MTDSKRNFLLFAFSIWAHLTLFASWYYHKTVNDDDDNHNDHDDDDENNETIYVCMYS